MCAFSIAVAVSGGLDSLMALCLLKDAGHKVLAVHGVFVPGHAERLDGLRHACDRLDVPLEIVDLSAEFAQQIIAPFAAAYAVGDTPNPCVACNRDMKFGLLLDAAVALGAERLATGHYARLDYFHTLQEDFLTLGRAADAGKDQAYFLGLVPPQSLRLAEFPLAGLCKADLREAVARRGLVVPESRESQEICFIPNDDYRAFLLDRGMGIDSPGPMLLPDGRQADIGIRGTTIAAVGRIEAEAGRVVDATGCLVAPPFVDPHFHLDATLSYGTPRINASGTLLEGIALWGELRAEATVDEMVEHALSYCDWAASMGLLAIR